MDFEKELPDGEHDWKIDYQSDSKANAHCQNCGMKIVARSSYKDLNFWLMVDPTNVSNIRMLINITEKCEETGSPPIMDDEFYIEWNDETHLSVYESWAKKVCEAHYDNEQVSVKDWKELAKNQWSHDIRKTKYFNGEY